MYITLFNNTFCTPWAIIIIIIIIIIITFHHKLGPFKHCACWFQNSQSLVIFQVSGCQSHCFVQHGSRLYMSVSDRIMWIVSVKNVECSTYGVYGSTFLVFAFQNWGMMWKKLMVLVYGQNFYPWTYQTWRGKSKPYTIIFSIRFHQLVFICETNQCCGVLLLLYVGSLPSPTMW